MLRKALDCLKKEVQQLKANLIDTRGLSCPQPVLLVKRAIDSLGRNGVVEVLVDENVAKENVSRLLINSGFNIIVVAKDDEYIIKGEK
jgi:TusA-related sulfurtransferase